MISGVQWPWSGAEPGSKLAGCLRADCVKETWKNQSTKMKIMREGKDPRNQSNSKAEE